MEKRKRPGPGKNVPDGKPDGAGERLRPGPETVPEDGNSPKAEGMSVEEIRARILRDFPEDGNLTDIRLADLDDDDDDDDWNLPNWEELKDLSPEELDRRLDEAQEELRRLEEERQKNDRQRIHDRVDRVMAAQREAQERAEPIPLQGARHPRPEEAADLEDLLNLGLFPVTCEKITAGDSLTGRFVNAKGGRILFLALGETAAFGLPCFAELPALERALRHFADRGDEFDLFQGPAKEGDGPEVFRVAAMGYAEAPPKAKRIRDSHPEISDRELQLILRRLLSSRNGAPDGGTRAAVSPVNVLNRPQLREFFDLTRAAYPADMQDWAESNFQQMDNPQGSDGRRHAESALRKMLSVDWSVRPATAPPLPEVRRRLDERFYGMESVKRQILELAARIRQTGTLPRHGILLVGPPGVGKTSVATFLGELLGLPQRVFDLSVVNDGNVLSGSGRLYSNARCGRIVDEIVSCGSGSLVLVIDEADKAHGGREYGFSQDVLLSLADNRFVDNFIEGRVPMDGVLLMLTANDASQLSEPLRDRLTRIDIPAYTETEKRIIFQKHIFARAMADIGHPEASLTSGAMKCLLSDYAVTPGVRELEQAADKLVGDVLFRQEMEEQKSAVRLTTADVRRILGPGKSLRRSFGEAPGQALCVGAKNGVPTVFPLQATVRPGSGRFELFNVLGPGTLHAYCRMAYEAVRQMTGTELDCLDVTLFAPDPLLDTTRNGVGLAAAVAILSAMRDVTLRGTELLLGGVDAAGLLYLDETDISPLLAQAADGKTTVYSALGAGARVGQATEKAIQILEFPTLDLLWELLTAWH